MDILFNNITNALGWALIHFVWQGLILCVCYWAITRFIFKNNFSLKYWTGILFISLSLLLPIREFLTKFNTNIDLNILHPINTAGFLETSGILHPTDILLSLIQKSLPFLVVVWFFIIILISLNLTKSWLALLKISKNMEYKVPKSMASFLKDKSKQLNLRFKPIISISKEVIIPATFGFFRPVVLLPSSIFIKLPQEQIEAIILHELCHIKRADFIHNILQLLVETLFFYHPLIKWMSRDIRKTREQCCDELVLKSDIKPIVYAKALTNIASIITKKNGVNHSYIQISATDGELFNRIKFLMVNKKPSLPFPFILIGLTGFLLMFFVLKNLNHTIIKSNNPLLNISTYVKSDDSTELYRPHYKIPNINSLQNQAQKNFKNTAIKTSNTKKHAANSVLVAKKDLIIQQNTHKTNPLNNTETQITQIADNNNHVIDDINMEDGKPTIVANETYIDKYDENKLQEEVANNLSFKAPQIIKKVIPKYNRTAEMLGLQGMVILSFSINENGKTKDIRIDKRSKSRYIDSISKRALRSWRFDKKTVNSINIKHRYQQIFQFDLQEPSANCALPQTGTRILNKECYK